jgi:ATP-dependent helicase/nuclease subunit B
VPIDLVTTPYGRPALLALRDAVAAAKAGEPLAPVTVVVPANHAGVAARRLLAGGAAGAVVPGGRGLAGVTFVTPYRLAELLGASRLAAAKRRPVSTPVVAAALRQALVADPGVFAPVAAHPATEAALVAAHSLLADVPEAALSAVRTASPRAADVVRLHRQARARLAPGWYDESELAAAATEAAIAGDSVVGDVGHVIVHLVQELTRSQAALLRAVADRWPTTVVAATTGVASADAGVTRSLDRLACKPVAGPAATVPGPGAPPDATAVAAGGLGAGGAGLVGPSVWSEPSGPSGGAGWSGRSTVVDAPWPVAAERTRVLTASDADDEVRAAVRAVVDAARGGTPLERVAVLYGAPEPYGRLLHEHLAAAGVPRNGVAVRPLVSSAVGRIVSDLLALPDRAYRRRDVMGLVARTAVRTPSGAPAPMGEWERLSREGGVVAGRHDWDALLTRLADGLEAHARALDGPDADPGPAPVAEASATAAGPVGGPATGDSDGEDGEDDEPVRRWGDAARRRAARARDLRAVVLDLVAELDAAADSVVSWRERAWWLRRLVIRLLGDTHERSAWPPDEHRAADKVDAALERLSALDAVDDAPTFDTFRRTLELELEADLGRVGRFGEGVLVAPLSFAPGLDLDLLVVVGLAEGTLPGVVRDDSLLPDHERRRAGGELPLARERVDRQHRHLRAAVAGAERHLLCAPRGDLRASNDRVPSRWLLEVASQLRDAPVMAEGFHRLDEPWLTHVPSFAHAVTHATFPATEQEYRLRSGGRRTADAVAAAGADVVAARRSRSFTRFDGNLAGLAVPSPADTTTSATRLEAWATCPHAYFMRYLLGVEPLDAPERQLTITPLDKGSLVHEVLEAFVRRVLDRPEHERPGPDEPWTDDDRRTMAAIAAEACDDYEARGLTGRPVFWRRDRAQVLALAERFLREDERYRRTSRTRPLAAELTFGREGSPYEAVALPLPDGRVLQFAGAIDRLDLAEDGTLVVSDYKTGRSTSYRGLTGDDPHKHGTRLQLAIYAQAARAVHGVPDAPARADYWFVSDREGFARLGYSVDGAVLDRVTGVLATIAEGIERGVFPSRPDDAGGFYVSCRYCDPDGMGVTELRRDWEHMRDDPAVVAYAALAEPDELEAAR